MIQHNLRRNTQDSYSVYKSNGIWQQEVYSVTITQRLLWLAISFKVVYIIIPFTDRLILLISYKFTASCGDYSYEDYPDHTYLSSYRFVPQQDQTLQRKIMENHKKHMLVIYSSNLSSSK